MGETVRAWRFVGQDDDDNRPVATRLEWVEFTGPLEPGFSGMVGSEQPLDALYLGMGNVVTRIELRSEIERAGEQLVARSQRLLWRADAAAPLMAFARQEALAVADLWDAPESVRRYLRTQDQGLLDVAFNLALANGSRAASAAMMAMGPDSDERAWQNAYTALSHALDARADAAGSSADSVAALQEERARLDARMAAFLERLSRSAATQGNAR